MFAAIATTVSVLTFIALYVLGAVYAERKVSAYIQDRLGPTETGPNGLLQTLADILKLVRKENIIPDAADKPLFLLAPAIVFLSIFAGFAVIPLGTSAQENAMHVGLFFLLAIIAVDILGILMAGWGSNNKYALLGSMRSAAQIIAYEIPAGLALLAAIMMFGTLNFAEISLLQGSAYTGGSYFLGIWEITGVGGIPAWAIFRYPHLLIAMLIYFIAALAECNRAPFDLPEAESELIAGFHTEYSGFRFSLFFLAEYAKMFLTGIIIAFVFLGGWNSPFPNIGGLKLATLTTGLPGTTAFVIWGIFWVLVKAFLIVFSFIWIRWTVPRVRVDQLMRISWKVLTPIALLLILISGIWKLLEVYGHLS